MPYNWKGNYRSGVALAVRPRLKEQALRKRGEHPAYTHHRVLALIHNKYECKVPAAF